MLGARVCLVELLPEGIELERNVGDFCPQPSVFREQGLPAFAQRECLFRRCLACSSLGWIWHGLTTLPDHLAQNGKLNFAKIVFGRYLRKIKCETESHKKLDWWNCVHN
jgi:hypothetical protein